MGGASTVRSPDGYESLYRAHYARILRLCRLLLRDATEAEDVAQEVFVAALAEWNGVVRAMRWGPWLTTVAVHACHRRRRGRWWQWWRGAQEAFVPDELPGRARAPEDAAAERERRERIGATFARLTLRQQEVFLLRHVEGFSTREVAEALGVAEGSVKRHLFRATTAFRDALEDRS
jgi:RNA polymerase sigma-70 factor (ECF subfamily)